MLHTKLFNQHCPVCGRDTPAANQQPILHRAAVARPAAKIAHVPRFCGVVPRANPSQSIKRLERPGFPA